MSNMGFNNMIGFVGVVENIDRASGRVQIRCFGFHPSYAEDPTFEGPWATIINGTYGNVNFIPSRAEWVFGMFVDGQDAQQPLIFGSLPGANSTLPSGSGDEAENDYVKPSREAIDKYGQPAVHPSISGEDTTETPVFMANATARNGVSAADGHTFSEPDVSTGGDPSKITVLSPGYGKSQVEISGTEGSEHIAITHATGSQVQIDASGNIKLKSMGDMYSFAEGHSREFTSGRRDVVVDGRYTINVTGGDAHIKVAGDITFDAKNDVNFNVSGRMNFNVGESITMTGSKLNFHAREDNVDIYAGNKLKIHSDNDMVIKSKEDLYIKANAIDLKGSDDVLIQSSGIASVKAGSYFAADGSIVYINGTSTFVDGNPVFDSGVASGKAKIAALPPFDAVPIKQDDVDARATVGSVDQQYGRQSSPYTGSGGRSLDDSDGTTSQTDVDTGTAVFDAESIVRNRNNGIAGSLLEVIGDAESNGDYNSVYSGTRIALPKPITEMTISELQTWQDESVAAGSASSAAGKYQVIRKTLRSATGSTEGITTSSIYNVETQDTIAYYLLERRGLSSYRSGKITEEQFANRLAQEWAGLPVVSGASAGSSYYDGDGLNKANATPSSVLTAIREIGLE